MSSPNPNPAAHPDGHKEPAPDGNPPTPSDTSGPSLRKWFQHAFSVDDGGAKEPTPEEAEVVDKVLTAIVRRGLATPALLFIETCRPLNYVGAQALHYFAPFAEIVLPAAGYRLFAGFLERRASIDYLCRRLQELDEKLRRPK